MASALYPERSPDVLHVLAPMREGGLERVVTMLARRQIDGGVHVAVVLEPHDVHDHPFVERLRMSGVPVTVIAVGARSYGSEYRALSHLISRLAPRIVHTHGYRADIIAGAAARRSRASHVSTVHGFTAGAGGFRNRFYEMLQRFSLRKSRAVMAVSAPLVARLVGAGIARSRIHLVVNGFVPDGATLARGEARARLGIPPGEKTIGWIGRLSTEKGADVMLDALAMTDPWWKLSILGEGPELGSLRARADRLGIAGRVKWHGSVGGAGALLTAFDAFVLSSRTEGTPIALFEAMHAGVPVIATAVGGVPDVITGNQAILVSPERPELIAAALAELTRDPRGATRRAELARERLGNEFGHTKWLEAINTVYAVAERSA